MAKALSVKVNGHLGIAQKELFAHYKCELGLITIEHHTSPVYGIVQT